MNELSYKNSVLTFSNCPVPNALLVAHGNGFLDKAGIELHVLEGAAGQTHFTYDQPDYTRFGGEIPPLVSEGLRAPGRTKLLGITPLTPLQGFYVRAESDIHKPADLKGRRVGVSASATYILRRDLGDYRDLPPWEQTLRALGTWEARALLRTLEAGGLTLNDVELVRVESPGVDVSPQSLDQAATIKGADLFPDTARRQADILEHGQAEAIFAWLPWAAELELCFGARSVLDLSIDRRNSYASVWTVSSALIETKPEVVQKLVNAVVEAGVWASRKPYETIRLHAENLGVCEQSVPRGFGNGFHTGLVPRLDAEALSLLENTASWLLDQQLIDHPVPLDRWAAPEFLTNALRQIQTTVKS
jgi:ABC-type nitrate/sulfonate/bicarbonate transport system substrate-binding protein